MDEADPTLRVRIEAALSGLAPPPQPLDGSCLRWSLQITRTLVDAGFAARTVSVVGWVDRGGKLVGWLHQATMVDGLVVDYTARQFSPDLPARWMVPWPEYTRAMAAITGSEEVTDLHAEGMP